MALALITAVVLFPILELALMFKIGSAIGIVQLLLLVIGMALFGGLILRQQGLTVMRRALDQLSRNETPVQSMIDGIGLSLAGVLFLIPGLISDLAGLLLLVPTIRRRLVGKLLGGAAVRFEAPSGAQASRGSPDPGSARGRPSSPDEAPNPARAGARDAVVIDGEFERLEERTIRPGPAADNDRTDSPKDLPPGHSPWRN